MDEDPTETGIDHPQAAAASVQPIDEKAARDAEFTLFYKATMPRLMAFLLYHGASVHNAADLTQDAMTEAYRNWDAIDSPRTWVRVVASHKWWRQIERDRRQVPSADPAGGISSPLLNSAAEEIESRHAFLAIVRGLPRKQRQVMAWTWDGYQPTEIAAVLNESPDKIRSALRDARASLRKFLRKIHDPGQEG